MLRAVILLLFFTTQVIANDALQGKKAISLVEFQGKEIPIGTIDFFTKKKKISYQINIDHNLFKDFFLSMKEMKCLEGAELWCHLPYPYENPRIVSHQDLRWLSHDLLFMYKKKSEFGANFYNGIYYHFSIKGNEIVGVAQAVDLNLLAAPPEDTTTPPITEYDREEMELKHRWLPKLIIR